MAYKTETGTFKNNPTLKILEQDGEKENFVMSFGKKKAKAILANIEAIKEFVGEEGENSGDAF